MAKRLTAAVLQDLKRDPRFELVERPQGSLTISLPAGVGWERRLDWTEIHFQARLTSASGRSEVIAGHCWNWDLNVCAKQIADAAAQFGPS